MSIMEIKQVGYSYDNKKKVLKDINAEMEQGKLYAILGPSGCGKTTLLSLIGGLDSPGSGQIYFDGQDIAKTGLSDHRKNHVAFIFQAYNLIDYLTPAENVSLTSKLPPLPLLERLGLTKEEDPVKVEYDLMKVLPKDHWILYNLQIIALGREICKAPTAKCDACFLTEFCPYYKKNSGKKTTNKKTEGAR